MKKAVSLFIFAAMVLSLFGGMTVYASPAPVAPIELQTERDGNYLKLNLVTTDTVNFGGFEFANLPVCDDSVFEFQTLTSTVLTVNSGLTYLINTTGNLDVQSGTVIATFTYKINVLNYQYGDQYSFELILTDAYDYYLDSYAWYNADLTATYQEINNGEGPVVLQTERDGDSILLKLVATRSINFGSMQFNVPSCTVNDVPCDYVEYINLTSTSDFTVNNGTSPNIICSTTTDVAADDVIAVFHFNITDATQVQPSTIYHFTLVISKATDSTVTDYTWAPTTLEADYCEPLEPTVAFDQFMVRNRIPEDGKKDLRIMFKVTMNDSFLTLNETTYFGPTDFKFEIGNRYITLTRTDNNVTHRYECPKIYETNVDDGYILYNVTLVGISGSQFSWNFTAAPEIEYTYNNVTSTAGCAAVSFTIDDAINNNN